MIPYNLLSWQMYSDFFLSAGYSVSLIALLADSTAPGETESSSTAA